MLWNSKHTITSNFYFKAFMLYINIYVFIRWRPKFLLTLVKPESHIWCLLQEQPSSQEKNTSRKEKQVKIFFKIALSFAEIFTWLNKIYSILRKTLRIFFHLTHNCFSGLWDMVFNIVFWIPFLRVSFVVDSNLISIKWSINCRILSGLLHFIGTHYL